MKNEKSADNHYPSSVYFGITDDPDTWGMCCSEEMARKCAEENYQRPSPFDSAANFLLAAVSYVIVIPAIIILYFILACIAVTGMDTVLYLFSIPTTVIFRILACGSVTVIGCLIQLNDLRDVKDLIQCGYKAETWIRTPIYFCTWIVTVVFR